MIDFQDLMITQWGLGTILLVIFYVSIAFLLIIWLIPDTLDRWELEDQQRKLIPEMDCHVLGYFILGDEITYAVKDLADKHWHIRCG